MTSPRSGVTPWRPKVWPPKRGWWVNVMVFPRFGEEGEVFLYTATFSRRGGPEFLTFGDKDLNPTLNSLCVRWEEDGFIPLGEDLWGHHRGRVQLLEASDATSRWAASAYAARVVRTACSSSRRRVYLSSRNTADRRRGRPPSVHDRYTCQACNLACAEARPVPRVLQVVIADSAGRYPWEPGCAYPYPQPVLGPVPSLLC